MPNKTFITFAIILGLMLGSFACGRKGPGEIKIGFVLELTGALAPYGEYAKKAIDLALEEVNNGGGVDGKKVFAIFEDDSSDPKEGVAAFRKILSTHTVPVVIGAIASSVAMAIAPIANESKVVLFSCGATSPLLTNAGDYVFRNRLSGEVEVKAMADFAIKKLNLKSLALLYVNTDYGRGNKDVFEKLFRDLGGKLSLSESFEQGETDFRSQLAKVKSQNPDAVYIIGHVIESANILRQVRELGIKSRMLSTVGIEGPDLWKIAGNAANGVIYTVQGFDPSGAHEKSREFARKYSAKYGEAPELFAALGYDAVHIISLAIKDRGYDGEGIKNALYRIKDYQGAIGPVSFDQNGDIQSEIMMKIAQDGKFLPYKP